MSFATEHGRFLHYYQKTTIITGGHIQYLAGPTVRTETYLFRYFYEQHLVLFTIAPRIRLLQTLLPRRRPSVLLRGTVVNGIYGTNKTLHLSLFYCSILSLYRGSFNVSIGLDEASCAGLWSRPFFITPPFRLPL